MTKTTKTLENPARRKALRRLGLAVATAYVVPEIIMLSEASASSSSDVSFVTPPTPPSPPANLSELEVDERESDTCVEATSGAEQQITFSASDFERAQASVAAGYAKPLSAIGPQVGVDYSGKIIGIEFTGFRWLPRYRFKAISASGHLETVIVSARTGRIEEIIGC